MKRRLFNRNLRAQNLLELFLIAAVSGVLGVRFYLFLTGYPQVGSGELHIAHMLWGGALMLSAQVIMLAFLGMRVQRLAAVIGGLGFGIFIDEIGKFLTRDNNYFFRPAIGIIYAIFIVLYLVFNFLGRRRQLTEREYQLNALMQLEEAVEHNLDPHEKARVQELLNRTDPKTTVTKQLQVFLDDSHVVPSNAPSHVQRRLQFLSHRYQHFWKRRGSNTVVQVFFVAEAVLFIVVVFAGSYRSFDTALDVFQAHSSYSQFLVVGQLVSTFIAAGLAVYGAIQLTFNRHRAFEYFRWATLINLFLTEFFVFSRIQFRGLTSFVFNLGLLAFISYALDQERRAAQ